MTTGENEQGLYGALSNAMNDPQLIDDLLRHPEFISQAEQICYRIAGPEGGEDLLQEARLRILERLSQLNPNSIRNEGEFLGWFSQLARRVHLSRVLSAASVSSCTEQAKGWPDAPGDVPPDDVGRFLTHADACPYHARLLRTEEEKLRAIFRRARGIDSQGRIPWGDELRTSVVEHKRRLQNWRESAFKMGRLFGHVALFNGGIEIASCGKFYDFSKHISRNELDPYSGLQIRGVSSGSPDEDVLLGFYALAGVRHDGQEKTLELDNGYTVGLRVKQLGETTFDVYFRCVETSMLEAGRVADESVVELTGDEGLDSSSGGLAPSALLPLDVLAPPESAGWWPRSPGWQTTAMFALLILVAAPCLMVGKLWGQAAAGDEVLAQVKEPQARTLLPTQRATGMTEVLNSRAPKCAGPCYSWGELERQQNLGRRRGFDAFTKMHRVEVAGATLYEDNPAVPLIDHDPSTLIMGKWLLPDQIDSAIRSRPAATQSVVIPSMALTQEPGEHEIPDGRKAVVALQRVSSQLSAGKLAAGRAPRATPGQTLSPMNSHANRIDDQRSTPTLLLSHAAWGHSANKSEGTRASTSHQNVSYEDGKDSADNSALHFATTDALLRKVEDALTRLQVKVERVAERNPTTTKYKVMWVARTEPSWDKNSSVVTVNVYIYRKGEKKSADQYSYMGVGGSLDAAYEDAVGKAVKQVDRWIREGGGALYNADLPEEKLAGEYGDGYVIHPDRAEPDSGAPVGGRDVDADDRPGRSVETEEEDTKE